MSYCGNAQTLEARGNVISGGLYTTVRAVMHADWLVAVLFVAMVIGLWQLAGSWVDAYWFATPSEIATAVQVHGSDLVAASRDTFVRAVVGFGIGAGIGVVVGVVAGVSRVFEDVVDPVVGLTYSIPKIALLPALLLLMGYTDQSRVLIVALVAFYPAYINAHAGTRGIDPQLLRIAGNLEAGRIRTLAQVVVPAALPRIVAGLRISLAISYTILFVVEASGGQGRGLGMMIRLLVDTGDFHGTYAAMLCFAVLGLLSDRTLVIIGRVLTRGQVLQAIGNA